MTREELIEVMARAICAGQGLDWKDQFSIWSSNGDPLAHEAFKHDAAAALTALEAAGVRLVPVAWTDDGQTGLNAAVNAVPELLALREEVGRLGEQVRELSDCQRLTVLNRAVAEISRGVQSGVDPQASIERLVTIARNAAPEIVSSELPAAQTLKERKDG